MSDWMPMSDEAKRGQPVLVWNSRVADQPPQALKFGRCEILDTDGWIDTATVSGDGLYFNPNYFDWWAVLPPAPSSAANAKGD